ncbi:MAG: LptE family protein [Candidatus Omnitrophica bacterium]|nr:LptE family protein [Candidatus Omnitrophota bacterium]
MKKCKAIIFLLMFISGCGYTTGSLIPSHIKTIYVETFINKTSEPNIELDITNAVRDRYAWDGSLSIVNDKESADSMLQGEIVNFEKQPVAYGDDNEIAEYRLILTVNLIYTDLSKDKVMWEEKKFKADSEYYTTMKEQKFSSTNLDNQALIENAAKELALEVIARTVEGW